MFSTTKDKPSINYPALPTPGSPLAALARVMMIFLVLASTAFAQINPLDKQSTTQNAICPLSDDQVQKSIDAFNKIVPTLTQEPRCVNCHGGVDPFANPTNHGGGSVDATAECATCHSEMPAKRDGSPSKWRIANTEHFFRGKDGKTLCKQMRDVFKQGADFIGHLVDDNGNSKFTEVAFEGTRGLNDVGRDLVEHYRAEPPPRITQGGLINFGMEWINATGGEFKGDVDCGCEPSHYAIRIAFVMHLNVPGEASGSSSIGPFDVPIRFQDDGTFKGEETIFIGASGVTQECSGQTTATVGVRVKGMAVEEWEKNFMRLRIENSTPLSGVGNGQCGAKHVTLPISGNEQGGIEQNSEGRVGEPIVFDVVPPDPSITWDMRAEIVKRENP